MSYTRHREALLSALDSEDPSVAGLQSKIASFQKKQKKQIKVKEDYYDWIHNQRSLDGAEQAISRQILQACSNVLVYMENEKDYEGLFKSCDIYPDRRADAIKSIQEDIAYLQKPAEVNCVVSPLIAEVRSAFVEANGQSAVECKENERNAICAELLLDLRDELSTSLEEFDGVYSELFTETREHRRKVMLHMADNRNSGSPHSLPKSLSKAFDSFYVRCCKRAIPSNMTARLTCWKVI